MQETAVTILGLSIGLLFVTLLYFWGFSQVWIDEFRQNIFAVRDELFDYAASGKISFDHPAYTTLRSTFNGYIRFSHRLSAVYFVLLIVCTAFSNRGFMPRLLHDRWEEAAADLNDETRADLLAFRYKAWGNLLHFMFLSSFTKKLLFLLSVVGPVMIAQAYRKSKSMNEDVIEDSVTKTMLGKETFRRPIDTLDTEAYMCGRAHSAPAV